VDNIVDGRILGWKKYGDVLVDLKYGRSRMKKPFNIDNITIDF